MTSAQPRLAARALIVWQDKILLVNATPDRGDGKLCLLGGGVDVGFDLKENLRREILEETGLCAEIGDITAVSEFFDSDKDFHQVDLFFHTTVKEAILPESWRDAANVVERRGFFSLDAMQTMAVFPLFLKDGFWLRPDASAIIYRGAEYKE